MPPNVIDITDATPLFDFDAERIRLGEYETRTHPYERRSPTQVGEIPEEEGWATRVQNHISSVPTFQLTLSSEQIRRIKKDTISDERLEEFEAKKIIVSEDEFIADANGRILGLYLRYGKRLPWAQKASQDLVKEKFLEGSKEFCEHYPPPDADSKDQRFQVNYEEDKWRCQERGDPYGVFHMGIRRQQGQLKRTPFLTSQTLGGGSTHKYYAVSKWFQNIAPVTQTIGMVFQVAFPKQYESATRVVQHWTEEVPGFRALVHSPRQIATYFALNVNLVSRPHADPGDSNETFTVMHAFGDFDVESGGHIAVPILESRCYKMERDSLLFLKASELPHHTTRWKGMVGQRMSLVHIMQNDVANFEDKEPPPTPAEASRLMKEARGPDEVTWCPFCYRECKGSSGVLKHLVGIIKGGGDCMHDLIATRSWRDTKREEMVAVKRGRRRQKKARRLAESSNVRATDQNPTLREQAIGDRSIGKLLDDSKVLQHLNTAKATMEFEQREEITTKSRHKLHNLGDRTNTSELDGNHPALIGEVASGRKPTFEDLLPPGIETSESQLIADKNDYLLLQTAKVAKEWGLQKYLGL